MFSDYEFLRELADNAGLGQDKSPFYIQVSTELNFRTSPRWKDRTQSVQIGNCTFIFPHPIDILIAK